MTLSARIPSLTVCTTEAPDILSLGPGENLRCLDSKKVKLGRKDVHVRLDKRNNTGRALQPEEYTTRLL